MHDPSLFKLALQALWKLVPMWKKFTHPSIASFRGVATTPFRLALVYDWGEDGNIMQYMESNPEAPRLTLVLILLLHAVHPSNPASGL